MLTRSTPENVARQLRQEAGFGCCKCGYPIFEYHHIVEWHKFKHFNADDMMILCPNCHEEVTHAHVPEKEQRTWKQNPFNIQAGFAEGLLKINGDLPQIRCGNSLFTHVQAVLHVRNEDLLSLRLSEEGRLLLNAKSYNRHDKLVFSIEDNVWITGETSPWDLKASWLQVRMWHKTREIGFHVDARNAPIVVKGSFWREGVLVRLSDTSITVDNGISPFILGAFNLSYAKHAISVS